MKLRNLNKEESIPYHLLLIADPEMDAIAAYIHQSDIYVCEIADKLVSVCAIYPISATVCEIKNVAVMDDMQGKGYGRKTLEWVLDSLRIEGYKEVIIGTGNSGTLPLMLYQKLGFDITGIKLNFFVDNYAEPIFENGVQCKHMIMLRKDF